MFHSICSQVIHFTPVGTGSRTPAVFGVRVGEMGVWIEVAALKRVDVGSVEFKLDVLLTQVGNEASYIYYI